MTTTMAVLAQSKKVALLIFLACAALRASAQEDESSGGGGGGGGMPDFGGQKTCPPFRCTSGHSAVPKARPKFESSGCNSMGMGMQMFSQSRSDEHKHIVPCCDRWHACYQICGSSKRQCDDAFKKCCDDACAVIEDDEEKKQCEQTASISSMMLQLGDCRKYDETQRDSCQCVVSSKVTGYRKDAIRGFYRKYAPDSLDDDKVKALAEKADTRAKMAGLFQKLVAKYPKCIKKVKDPQQAMMEDMMKKMEKEDKEKKEEEGAAADPDDSDETQEL